MTSVGDRQSKSGIIKGHLLLVEDNIDFALGIAMQLRQVGFELQRVSTLCEAQELLRIKSFDVILLDLSLPDASGMAAIIGLRKLQGDAALLVLTGHNDAELAVSALRLGAQDYLTKPIRMTELIKAITTAIQQTQARTSGLPLSVLGRTAALHVIGDSPVWQRALGMIHAAAASPKTTVLVTGEPGVGKELAVQLIHHLSQRAKHPLISVNVACFPSSLMESELFGHELGAFTGANGRKRGLFEQADGGCLFLDEIGELPLALQAKLLRVIEGKPFRRLGGEKNLAPDVRLLSATNRSLKQMVGAGDFREDLYHRLRVLEIRLPPLRERGKDIEKLALHFLAHIGAEMGHTQAHLSPGVLPLLCQYHWPGNIRELRNVIERSLVLSRGKMIMAHHLPKEVHGQLTSLPNHTVRGMLTSPIGQEKEPPQTSSAPDAPPHGSSQTIRRSIHKERHQMPICASTLSFTNTSRKCWPCAMEMYPKPQSDSASRGKHCVVASKHLPVTVQSRIRASSRSLHLCGQGPTRLVQYRFCSKIYVGLRSGPLCVLATGATKTSA